MHLCHRYYVIFIIVSLMVFAFKLYLLALKNQSGSNPSFSPLWMNKRKTLILCKCLVDFVSEAFCPWTILLEKDICMDPLGKEWKPWESLSEGLLSGETERERERGSGIWHFRLPDIFLKGLCPPFPLSHHTLPEPQIWGIAGLRA